MPRFEYFIVAESYSVDRDTSAISIFNVFGKVPCELPGRLPRLVALASWACTAEEIESSEEHHVTVIIRVPGKVDQEFRGGFRPSTRFQNIMLDLKDGLEIENAGDIQVELLFDGKHRAEHIFEVISVADAQ